MMDIMDIYVGLPRPLVSNTDQDALGQALFAALRRYYGKKIRIEFYTADAAGTPSVYVMGPPKYSGYEQKIRECIVHELCERLADVQPDSIDIKLNYAAFNPNFKPPAPGAQQKTAAPQAQQKKAPGKGYAGSDEFDYEKLSLNYSAEAPRYSFDQVILPEKTRNQIEEAIGVIEVEEKVFDEWGLRAIIPYAASALSFYGPPGTGKSMAAEAVAHKLGKKILSATYADIESKFHGEGPKMVKAIFKAAERDNAVLFLDESDSLLSKRLTNVSDGSSQAINSMRSQLLISLEHFKGIVIFATNLVVNYDKAFLSRLINIEFTMPEVNARTAIWNNHLRGSNIHIPLAEDVAIADLAEKYEFCGREIKNAVKNACISVALQKRDLVLQSDLIRACNITKEESERAVEAKDYTQSSPQSAPLSPAQQDALKSALQSKLNAAKKLEDHTEE